jgi:hypothetical protein
LRSPKKTSLIQKILKKKSKNFFYKKGIMQLSVQTLWCFAPENTKKNTSKVAHNRPPSFFFSNGPKTEIPYHQKPLNAGLGI